MKLVRFKKSCNLNSVTGRWWAEHGDIVVLVESKLTKTELCEYFTHTFITSYGIFSQDFSVEESSRSGKLSFYADEL